mgnify:CR=1 FL=1|tara:strand:+ start:775 stop:1296 length:522 start_codon:yes stop_codon:yes gene_type:complete
MNIKFFLIGMMGAGKSSIGLKLSQITKIPFLDIDNLIDSSNYIINNSIKKFRELEERKISKIDLIDDNLIISVGGGAILSPLNRKIIKKYYCIYLKTSLNILINRVSNQDVFRPLIQSKKNGNIDMHTFEDLFNSREKLYSNLANFIIKTDNKSVDELSQLIKNQLIKNEIIN